MKLGMGINDAMAFAWRQMARRPRAAATLVFGYSAIVVTASVVAATAWATRNRMTGTLWDIGAHTMAFLPLCAGQACAAPALDSAREGFEVNGVPSRLFFADAADKLRASPHIADVSPYLLYSMPALRGEGNWLVGGFDVTRPKAFSATVARPSQIAEGRFLAPGDRSVLMLDRELARTHGYRVGDTLQMGKTTLEVVGIVRPPLRPGKAHIYMSIEDARVVITPRVSVPIDGMVNALLLESHSAFSHAAAHDEIRRIMGSDVRIATFSCGEPGIQAMQTHMRLAGKIAALLAIGMSLLVLRGQAAAAHERRLEIAILKCIGWSDWAVLKPLAVESFILAATGCFAGALGAAAILVGISRYATAAAGANLHVGSVLLGIVWAIGLGLVATGLAAMAAARAQPAGLLRKP